MAFLIDAARSARAGHSPRRRLLWSVDLTEQRKPMAEAADMLGSQRAVVAEVAGQREADPSPEVACAYHLVAA